MDTGGHAAAKTVSGAASRWVAFTLLGLALLVSTGCVQESVDGSTHTFTYELWAPFSVLLGGLAMVPVGWIVRPRSARIGWILIILGTLGAVLMGPSMLRDRAVVDEQHFSLRTGIWGLTAVHDVPYDHLTRVRYIMEETRGRRGRKNQNYYLVCERNDGAPSKVPLGSPVAEAAAPQFLDHVIAHGIPVVDET